MALVVVMIAIFVLSLLVGIFAFTMKVEMRLAQNSNNDTALMWLGRSGVERARWILAQQLLVRNEPYDSLDQKWAGGPGGIGESNSPLANISLDNYQVNEQQDDGSISIRITDLERRININTANVPVLRQALNVMGVDASEIDPVADSVLDWVDADNDPHLNGAESDYYQTLNPPYNSKNGPLDDLSELLLVKEIVDHRELYYGQDATNHFQQFDKFGRLIEPPAYPCGLRDLFTALSIGKVNINTATNYVLQVLLNGDENMANAVIEARAGVDGQPLPFRSVADLGGIRGITRQAVSQLQAYCDVRSRTFEVEVTASLGGSQRVFHAILGRNNQRDIQVLSFHPD
jgi:general secretion pathway protein K